jgi:hypothetical protein
MYSVRGLIKGYLKAPLSVFIPAVERFEEEMNPGLGYLNAVNSIVESGVNALIIHSTDDKVVSFKHNFKGIFLQFTVGNEQVRFFCHFDTVDTEYDFACSNTKAEICGNLIHSRSLPPPRPRKQSRQLQ